MVEVIVIGRQVGTFPPGLPETRTGARYTITEDPDEVGRQLPGAEVVFHYGQPRTALRDHWAEARRLRWVQVAGVGVDWSLFPELVESDVTLTNSRGVFDTSLPEYLLAMMLALAKDLPATLALQARGEWRHRLVEPLSGGRALVVGAGSLGHATGRLLRALGMTVTLVGRTERRGDPADGRIRAVADLPELLPETDWLIVITPLTAETRGLIGERELALLPAGARLANIGRGPVVAQDALVAALRSGHLAGAALDVFETEPLPPDDPLWSMPNVIVSPHIGGDEAGTPMAFTRAFLENLERYMAGQPLRNVVDKRLGYVPSVGDPGEPA
jgi:phosphoglycerate dehydrogenase-like enzyme